MPRFFLSSSATTSTLLAALLVAAGTVGCPGNSPEVMPGTDAGPQHDAQPGDAAITHDTGTTIDAGGDAASDTGATMDTGSDALVEAGPPATARAGRVLVTYEALPSGGSSGGMTVRFQETTSSSCSMRKVGSCDVTRCDLVNGTSPSFTNLGAGAVSVTGGSSPMTVTPASDGSYSFSGALATFTAGSDVTMSASGDAIAAFSTHVTFPASITVTNPGASGPVIDHTKDLALAWTGGGSSQVLVNITETVLDRAVIIQCVFDAAGGSATVPAAALSDLEAATLGSGGGEGDLSILSVGLQELTPGGFPIIVGAGSSVYSALPTIQ